MAGDGWKETFQLYDELQKKFPDKLGDRMRTLEYFESPEGKKAVAALLAGAASAENSQATLSQQSAMELPENMGGGRRRSRRRGYKKQRGGAWTPQMLAALKTILYLLFLHQFITQGGAAAVQDAAGRAAGAAAGAIDGAVVAAYTNGGTLLTRMQAGANEMCSNPFSRPAIVQGGCAFALRASAEAGSIFSSGGANTPALTTLFAGLVALYAALQGLGFVVALPGQVWGIMRGVAAPALEHGRQVLGGIDGWIDALARVLLDRMFGPNGVNAGTQAMLEERVQRGPPPPGDPDGPPGKGPGPAGAGAGAASGGRRRGRKVRRATKKVMKRRSGTSGPGLKARRRNTTRKY
jgi:hypothetical protein